MKLSYADTVILFGLFVTIVFSTQLLIESRRQLKLDQNKRKLENIYSKK